MIFRRKKKDNLENKIPRSKKKLFQEYEENLKNEISLMEQNAVQPYDHGAYEDAIYKTEEGSKIIKKIFGENHKYYANILSHLGKLYFDSGDHAKAEPLFQKVIEIRRQVLGENHKYYARSLRNLALVYLSAGEYAKAEPLFQKASEIILKVEGENNPDYAANLDNQASLYTAIFDYAKARHFLVKAVKIRREVFGINDLTYAVSLCNLGFVYYTIANRIKGDQATEDYAKAESFIQKASEIILKVEGENNPDYAAGLNNLALVYQATGNYAKAEPLFQKASEIILKVEGENSSRYASSLHNLASLYLSTGEYAKAEYFCQKALESIRVAMSEKHQLVPVVNFLRTIASTYAVISIKTSRQTPAHSILQESVTIEDKMLDQIFSVASGKQRMSFIKELRSSVDLYLSLMFQRLSQDQVAVKNAADLVMKRKSIDAEAITVQQEMVLTGKYPHLRSTLLELNNIRREISQKSLAGPTAQEEYDKYKQYLEQLNVRKEKLETELARQIPEIQLQRSLKMTDAQALINALPEGTSLVEFVRFFKQEFNAVVTNRVIDNWQWDSPHYLAFILQRKKLESIRMLDLGDAEIIDKLVALFIKSTVEAGAAQANHQNKDDGKRLIAANKSGSSHQKLENNNNANWMDLGFELYKLIFYPLLSEIGDCKKLLIAPDGDLNKLPFEILPRSKERGTNLIIDDYSIRYLTTARDIIHTNKQSDGLPNESIVAADPDFDLDINRGTSLSSLNKTTQTSYTQSADPIEDIIIGIPVNRQSRDFDRSTISFKRLVETEKEGKEISRLLGVQPWTGESVLESRIKACKSPRILHLATHGFFFSNQEPDENKINTGVMNLSRGASINLYSWKKLENPLLRSGLALAGANTWARGGTLPEEAEDGILTAEDVCGMDLFNTELVVLSACETGLGEVFNGEGVFGLRRAFILAGAKSLVMSLWKVPDEQTKELMVDFYERLLSGIPRAEALREAQLAMKRKYPNPYYWGAFICQGNPDSITGTKTNK